MDCMWVFRDGGRPGGGGREAEGRLEGRLKAEC